MMKIMCVDDNSNIVTIIQQDLERCIGCSVTAFTNPEDALKHLEDTKSRDGEEYDVIISDYSMPNMTGIDFLLQSRESSPKSRRIMLTGFADEINWESRLLDCELYCFVTKPYNWVHLCHAVSEAFQMMHLDEMDGDDTVFTGSLLVSKIEGLSSDSGDDSRHNRLGIFQAKLATLVSERFGTHIPTLGPGKTLSYFVHSPILALDTALRLHDYLSRDIFQGVTCRFALSHGKMQLEALDAKSLLARKPVEEVQQVMESGPGQQIDIVMAQSFYDEFKKIDIDARCQELGQDVTAMDFLYEGDITRLNEAIKQLKDKQSKEDRLFAEKDENEEAAKNYITLMREMDALHKIIDALQERTNQSEHEMNRLKVLMDSFSYVHRLIENGTLKWESVPYGEHTYYQIIK